MKWAFIIAVLLHFLVIGILFGPAILEQPWWKDVLLAIPGVAAAVIAYFELGHSREANELRREANGLRTRIAELEAEKTEHLKQIAQNTQRPVSEAERRASILRKHLGATVAVSEGKGVWATSPVVAEVNDDNSVALFSPRSPSSGQAWCQYVRCDDLEVVEPPQGLPQVRVLKRYGDPIQLGDISKWEDRSQPRAAPAFNKGDVVYHASFRKPGASETRSLYVYRAQDGANSFMLEASTGERVVSDNIGVSKRFSAMEIDYAAEGFERGNSGTGGSNAHRLFIR
jgi:hypothetical protein